MRTVRGQFCGIFRWIFRSCWANLARALSVPGRSFVLGASNCTAEGDELVCALLKCAFFVLFYRIFVFSSAAVRTWPLFVQRWTGHGRQNSNDVCGIV